MIKSGKSNLAWPRRFQRHPTSLSLPLIKAQRAQKYIFRVVFPIFWQPWVVKKIECGKSDSTWSDGFNNTQWAYIWPKKRLRDLKNTFSGKFFLFSGNPKLPKWSKVVNLTWPGPDSFNDTQWAQLGPKSSSESSKTCFQGSFYYFPATLSWENDQKW